VRQAGAFRLFCLIRTPTCASKRLSVHQLFFACARFSCSLRVQAQCINPQRCSLRSVHQSTMLFFALGINPQCCSLRCTELSASIHNAVLALSASIHNAVLCVCTELSASIHNAVLCAQCINPQCCSLRVHGAPCNQCCSLRSVHQSQCCSLRVHGLSASIAQCQFFALSASIQCCSLRVHGAFIHQSNCSFALGASIHNAVLCVCTALRAWGPT
jgi:hypothetical protein